MDCMTIASSLEEETVIRKSRFICSLGKVYSEEEAQDFIRSIKKRYWDATHNCSAYIVGEDGTARRSSDDGEPSGTAGIPMLEVLQRAGLVNVVAVVTRYFGGIKLGAGGLVRAYSGCVAEAVQHAGIARIIPVGIYCFPWNAADVGRILNILYTCHIFNVADVDYGEDAVITIALPVARLDEAREWLRESLGREISLKQLTIRNEEVRMEEKE